MRTTMTISLPAELAKAVDKKAKARGVSRSRIIQDSLVEQQLERDFLAVQDKVTKRAQAMGIFTDEDVYERLGIRSK